MEPLAHSMPPAPRLADARDEKSAWITLLTTEHYGLQMQRVATISEATGRASVFLGAVSAGLIALGFASAGHGRSLGITVFQMLVLTPLVFLGLVAFLRCLEIAIDDWEYQARIASLRATYARLVPQLAGDLAAASGAEQLAVMFSGRWRAFQKMVSVAGSVAVVTSVVVGADAGVLTWGFHAVLPVAIVVGTIAGLAVLGWLTYYQWRRWCQAS